MRNITWQPILAWALAAFFIFGGVVNILAPESVAEDYRRWGFPDWFHIVTGVMELAAALLLFRAATRLWGAGLVILVMSAAVLTTLRHGEFTHALAPLAILLLATLLGVNTLKSKALQGR